MVTILLLVSALAGLFSAAEGQDLRFGKCPTPPVQEDFDLTKFLGIWYEIEKIPAPFEKGNCVQVNYTAMENGNIKAINQLQKSDGSVRQTTSEIIRANLAEPAKMGVKYASCEKNCQCSLSQLGPQEVTNRLRSSISMARMGWRKQVATPLSAQFIYD